MAPIEVKKICCSELFPSASESRRLGTGKKEEEEVEKQLLLTIPVCDIVFLASFIDRS